MSINELLDEEQETMRKSYWARRLGLIWLPIMAVGLYLVAFPVDGVINGRDILGVMIVIAGIAGVFVDMQMVNRGRWR